MIRPAALAAMAAALAIALACASAPARRPPTPTLTPLAVSTTVSPAVTLTPLMSSLSPLDSRVGTPLPSPKPSLLPMYAVAFDPALIPYAYNCGGHWFPWRPEQLETAVEYDVRDEGILKIMNMVGSGSAGWRLVAHDGEKTLLMRLAPGARIPDYFIFEMRADGPNYVGNGDCQPVAVLDGVIPAAWHPIHTDDVRNPGTRKLRVELRHPWCGGEVGAIHDPQLTMLPNDVLLVVPVEENNSGDMCNAGGGPTALTVDLGQSLSGRHRWNAGFFPPLAPTENNWWDN